MNQRKLHFELMRTILKSSSLSYDEAFPLMSSLSPLISQTIRRQEQLVEAKKLEDLKKKEEEEEARRKRMMIRKE